MGGGIFSIFTGTQGFGSCMPTPPHTLPTCEPAAYGIGQAFVHTLYTSPISVIFNTLHTLPTRKHAAQ